MTLIAGDVVRLDELNWLCRKSDVRGAGLVLHAWATIAAAMTAYVLWPSPLTLVAAIAVVGSRQLGLAVLMHEASHWLLFSRMRLNTWVGSWLCGFPIGEDLRAYRRAHHLHHRYTQGPEDPERERSAPFPVPRHTLWRLALGDLTGWTVGARALAWRPWGDAERAGWRRLRGPLLANGILLGALATVGHWELYPLLWLLPRVTWYQLVSRLRALAEHGMATQDDDQLRNTRTTGAGWLARAFLAPYCVNYHLEHHLLVFTPCWKLARAHALLLAKGYGGRMEQAPGYLDVIRRATKEVAL